LVLVEHLLLVRFSHKQIVDNYYSQLATIVAVIQRC